MSVIHAPGMAFDASTGKVRLVGTMAAAFDVTLDVSGLPGLGDALVGDMTDDQRAAVLAAFLATPDGVAAIVKAARDRGRYATGARAYTLSDQDTEPDCDHWRTVCDACKHTCRVCEQDQGSDDALRTHLDNVHDIRSGDLRNCPHCGVPGGH